MSEKGEAGCSMKRKWNSGTDKLCEQRNPQNRVRKKRKGFLAEESRRGSRLDNQEKTHLQDVGWTRDGTTGLRGTQRCGTWVGRRT
eukprot:9746482-Ditylum_brightwellii.AAC.1